MTRTHTFGDFTHDSWPGNNTPRVLLMDACGQRNCACVKVKFALCDCILHARKVQLLDNCIPGPPNVYVRVTRPFRFFFPEGLARKTICKQIGKRRKLSHALNLNCEGEHKVSIVGSCWERITGQKLSI